MWVPKLSSAENFNEHLHHDHTEGEQEQGTDEVDSNDVLGGAFSNTTSAAQDVTKNDIPLTVHSTLSIKDQFEAGETIKQIQHDARDKTFRGKLFSFLTMHRLSKWLRNSMVFYALAIVNQVFNVIMIVTSVVALVVVSDPMFYSPDPNDPLWNLVIESTTVAYFTVDYILKVFSAPSWWRFVIRFLSICDALSFLPTYIEFIVDATGSSASIGFLKVLRLFRLFRFATMFKDSILLESVRRAIVMSKDGLVLLCAAIAINLLFFSTAIWVAETAQCTFFDGAWHYNANNVTTPYQSIYVSFYWNIITITTVGYGDVFPVTPGGRVVACFAALSGLLMLAFPLTIFSTNFQNVYMELSKKSATVEEVDDLWERTKKLGEKEEATQAMVASLCKKIDRLQALLELTQLKQLSDGHVETKKMDEN